VAVARSNSEVVSVKTSGKLMTGTKTVSSANAIGVSTPPKNPGITVTGVAEGDGSSAPSPYALCSPTLASQTTSPLSRSAAMTVPVLPPPMARALC
jgi:hypothetical protein